MQISLGDTFGASLLAPTTEERTCRECAKPFTVPVRLMARFVFVCGDCSERHAIEDQKKAIDRSSAIRAAQWGSICPRAFVSTDPAKLPNQTAFQSVMQWQFGPKGLLMHGRTGRGKSRVAWLVAQREWLARRSLAVLNSASGIRYASLYSESPAQLERWINRLAEADMLLIDDTFKVRLTDSFEQMIFLVVTRRTECELPCLVTTNDTIESLTSRMSADRGEPFVRRLREHCRAIQF
jgi:hypothetical protein